MPLKEKRTSEYCTADGINKEQPLPHPISTSPTLYNIMVRARKEAPKGSAPLPSTFLGDTPRSCGLSTPLRQSLQAHHYRGVPRPSERSYPSNIALHTELYWSQSRPILLYVTSYIGSCTDLYWFIPPTYIALPTKAYPPPEESSFTHCNFLCIYPRLRAAFHSIDTADRCIKNYRIFVDNSEQQPSLLT